MNMLTIQNAIKLWQKIFKEPARITKEEAKSRELFSRNSTIIPLFLENNDIRILLFQKIYK